jgi:transposase-like protein
MLVIIGATPEGKKELLGFRVGVRESAQSWRELLIDLKKRGLAIAPEIAVGDGAMGFWKALEEVFPATRHQRCWQHKLVNILNKAPKSVQPGMKEALCEVRDAPDRATAEAAIKVFAEKFQAKYPKAVECLTKDREPLLAFLDFPAEPPSQPAGCAHFMDRIKGLLAFDGITCAPPTRSRACSPRSAIEQCGPKARCRARGPN